MHWQLRAIDYGRGHHESKGAPNFTSYSAGSHPSGKVRPEALQQIEDAGLNTAGFRSKSWDEFATPNAPVMNFVFTVCDNAANEVCPVWPGQPITAHWGVPDRAAATGTPQEIARAVSSGTRRLEAVTRCGSGRTLRPRHSYWRTVVRQSPHYRKPLKGRSNRNSHRRRGKSSPPT
jgi:protein-tyrosine-phosphatase